MLEKELKKVTDEVYPFHMPGHKRQKEWTKGLLDFDITEIDGSDNLHSPNGVILRAQRRASSLCKSVSTIFLSGGSTAGILSAISAVCQKNSKIVIARNCHKSVYNACLINGLQTEFVYPAVKNSLGVFGEVLPSDIACAMDKSGAKTVVITSPTYEGIVSDIKTIAKTVHSRGGLLIVDSAHGAHLGFNGYFPPTARTLGADIVIESAHKTLPCLTGAALLHICSHRINYEDIRSQIEIFETSSPPYPIICSIDRFFEKQSKQDLFTPYVKRLENFYGEAKNLKNLSLFESSYSDKGKIVIMTENADISGFELKRILREKYEIELEMAMPGFALAMTSLADTDEGFDRLIFALKEIDKTLKEKKKSILLFQPKAETRRSMSFAQTADFEVLPIEKCVGRVSAEFVFAYPPGSPIIAPGEVLSREISDYLSYLLKNKAQIFSSKQNYPRFLAVLEEKD